MSEYEKKRKRNKKRTRKEAFGSLKKKSKKEIKKINPNRENCEIKIINNRDADNIITYDLNIYKDFVVDNSNNIIFKKDNLNIEVYENEFFRIIEITGDGNCFFRTISQYIYGSEKNYSNIRNLAYNYIVDHLNEIYDYCYIENGIYYIDIEERGTIKKYIG